MAVVTGFVILASSAYASFGPDFTAKINVGTDKNAYVIDTDTNINVSAYVEMNDGTPVPGIASGDFRTFIDNTSFGSVAYSDIGGGNYSATLSMSGLSAGEHTIWIFASTTDGVKAQGTTTISILERTNILASAVNYSTYGGKNNNDNLVITIPVKDNLGDAVVGAAISAKLYKNGKAFATFSGTTDANGNAVFTKTKIGAGNYNTVITSLSFGSLVWNGSTPANQYVK